MPTECTSFGSSTYTLVFSGSTIGDHIHDLKTTYGRLTEIAQRQNFWASDVILDGRYPALVFEHTFTLYKNSGGAVDYAKMFFALANKIEGDPRSLVAKIKSTTVISFGDCYMEPPEQQEPDSLLLTEAGLFTLKFLGTQIPSIA